MNGNFDINGKIWIKDEHFRKSWKKFGKKMNIFEKVEKNLEKRWTFSKKLKQIFEQKWKILSIKKKFGTKDKIVRKMQN